MCKTEIRIHTPVFCKVRKASNATMSKAVWYKMQLNGVSKRVVEWIKRTKDKIQCHVKWSYKEVNETVKTAQDKNKCESEIHTNLESN